MSKVNTGGPAFARSGFYDADGKPEHDNLPEDGMTLRDWFAGQALVGMGTWLPAGFGNLDTCEAVNSRAEWAYFQADAMIAAREVKP